MSLPGTLGDIIRESVRYARARGYQIMRGDWGVRYQPGLGWTVDPKNCVCPLGAVLLQHQPVPEFGYDLVYQYEEALAGLLNCSPFWLDDFTEGVDKGASSSNGSQFGHQLACELIDGIKP